MEFKQLLTRIKDNEIEVLNIFLHYNADPDAVCAGFALGSLVQNIFPEVQFHLLSDEINQTSKKVMRQFNISTIQSPVNETTFLNITVDLANYNQLGKYEDFVRRHLGKLVVIDHHSSREIANDASQCLVDPDAGSTSLIIARGFDLPKAILLPDIATLMLIGHLYDSRRFLYGVTATTFQRISRLLEAGGDYEIAVSILQNKPSHGEKIARLKGMQRLKYQLIEGWIGGISRVGSYEASMARSIINLGADFAFVTARKKTELRCSARTIGELKIDIASIMQRLASKYGGEGGGHQQAAGINIKRSVSNTEISNISRDFIEMVRSELS